MALFEITTFATVVKLLLAARKLLQAEIATLDRAKALADLASNGKALSAAISGSGLAPLAGEMEKLAKSLDRSLTHEGPALDNARLIFFQVAPVALSDPSHMASGALDPAKVTNLMVQAIKATDHARDFTQTTYAEDYFRAVMTGTLATMFAKVDYVDSIAPDLWRQTLKAQGIQIGLLTGIDATTKRSEQKVDETVDLTRQNHELLLRLLEQSGEAETARKSGVTEARIVALAQQVARDVGDPEQAFRELEAAVTDAIVYRAGPVLGANADAALSKLRDRLEDLADAGKLAEAQLEANKALAEWETQEAERQARATQTGIGYLNEGIRRDLDMRDAQGAAEKLVRRITLETPDPAACFKALRAERKKWFESGRDKGLALDLMVSIALARAAFSDAVEPKHRGKALVDLGNALATLGQRDPKSDRLEQAIVSYRAALDEYTRERIPHKWAGVQMNLGNALRALGNREAGTDRLEEAVGAYRSTLEEWTRDRNPLQWAKAQLNLGNALSNLGEREAGEARLLEAIAAFHAALEECTRDRVPLDWATAQMNLGNTLQALAKRERGTDRLVQAVAAYRMALEERTRDRVPLQWATTQMNLGNALLTMGEREPGTDRLFESVAAYRAALEERTRDRVPLDWAMARFNMAEAHRALFEKTGDRSQLDLAKTAVAEALEVFTASGAERYIDFATRLHDHLDTL